MASEQHDFKDRPVPIVGGPVSRPTDIRGVATGAYAAAYAFNRMRRAAQEKGEQLGLGG
jgi:hypothetical protein